MGNTPATVPAENSSAQEGDSAVPYSVQAGTPEEINTLSKPVKTKGERMFGVLRFGIAEVSILVATALIAYFDLYYKGGNNFLHKLSEGSEKFLSKKAKMPDWIATGISKMLFTSWGGTFFAPAMVMIDRAEKNITGFFNERFSTPQEKELADKRIDQKPKPTWGSAIRGRIIAMTTVTFSFLAAGKLLGKDPTTGALRFGQFEDWVGRWVGGHLGRNKGLLEIGNKGLGLPDAVKNISSSLDTKWYRYGKIIALDLFATTASVSIWIAANKFFSAMKGKKDNKKPEVSVPPQKEVAATEPLQAETAADEKSWTSGIQQKTIEKPSKPQSRQDYIDTRRSELPDAVPTMA